MLTYLINVTSDLFAVSVIAGVIFAFADCFCGRRGRLVIRIGLAAGLLIAAVRAYITNTRRIVGGWRVGAYGFGVSLAFFVLLIVVYAVFARFLFKKDADPKKKSRAELAVSIASALLLAAYMYCCLPTVYVYPFKFDTGGNGILSTDYLFRLGGYLCGLLSCFLVSLSAFKITLVVAKKGKEKLLIFSFMLINSIYIVFIFAKLMLVLTPRKIIDSIALFNFAAYVNNHSQWFAYTGFVLLSTLAIWIFIGSLTMKEAYATRATRNFMIKVPEHFE